MVTQGKRGSHSKKGSNQFVPFQDHCWLNEPQLVPIFTHIPLFSLRQILFIPSTFHFSVPLVQEMPKQTVLGKPCLWNGCFWQAGSGQELWVRQPGGYSTVTHTRLTQLQGWQFLELLDPPCKDKGLFLHFTVEILGRIVASQFQVVWRTREGLCQALRYLVMTQGGGGLNIKFLE